MLNPTKKTYQDFDNWLLELAKNAPVPVNSSSFGAVIPVTGLNNGFLGQVSRTNAGEPCIVARLANINNNADIKFGDTVVLLPDSDNGTYRQMADFLANGGETAQGTGNTNSNATLNGLSAGFVNGLSVGMFLFGAGIPAGTQIKSIESATSLTLSQNATATATGVSVYVAIFAGIAGREVKTQLSYPYTPGDAQIGSYAPGQMCEVMVGRGSITVAVPVGTPFSNSQVYLRIAANGGVPAGVVGDLEAAPDGANTIPLSGVVFKTGSLDANGVAEITFLTRILA